MITLVVRLMYFTQTGAQPKERSTQPVGASSGTGVNRRGISGHRPDRPGVSLRCVRHCRALSCPGDVFSTAHIKHLSSAQSTRLRNNVRA